MIRLAKKEFRHWLMKNRKVLVGEPNEKAKCPFCLYLKWRGAKKVCVPTVGYRIVDGQIHEHNKWQRDFQRLAMRKQRELDVIGLRGGEAIDILDSV